MTGNGVAALAGVVDAVRGVRWLARRAVAAAAPGAHRSRRRGTAVEFTEYRPYRQGDDPRGLDWKLLARTDRAYVRLTVDHAVLPTTIVVDASLSMAYPVETRGKWEMAAQLALGFAAVAQGSGDPVGLIVAAGPDVVAEAPRTTRRGSVASFASMLDGIVPGAPGLRGARRDSNVSGGGGRWVIVSDFLQDHATALARGRETVVSGGEVYAVHVVAREELDPPRRALLVSDPEDATIRRPLLDTSRAAYLDAFGAWRAQVRDAWQGAGARYTMVSTDEPTGRVVRRVVRL